MLVGGVVGGWSGGAGGLVVGGHEGVRVGAGLFGRQGRTSTLFSGTVTDSPLASEAALMMVVWACSSSSRHMWPRRCSELSPASLASVEVSCPGSSRAAVATPPEATTTPRARVPVVSHALRSRLRCLLPLWLRVMGRPSSKNREKALNRSIRCTQVGSIPVQPRTGPLGPGHRPPHAPPPARPSGGTRYSAADRPWSMPHPGPLPGRPWRVRRTAPREVALVRERIGRIKPAQRACFARHDDPDGRSRPGDGRGVGRAGSSVFAPGADAVPLGRSRRADGQR